MVCDFEIRVASLRFLSKKNNLFTVGLENGSDYRLHADFVVKNNIKKKIRVRIELNRIT